MYPIDVFWRAARRYPERPAIIGPQGTLTFAELGARVALQAAALAALVPQDDDKIAVAAANSVAHLEAILAILAASRVWVPLNPRNGDSELRRQIEFVRPAIILADEDMAARIATASAPMRLLNETLGRAADPGPTRQPPIPLGRTQAIKFTGGSTGAPKGVEQPLRAWNANIVSQALSLKLGPQDRCLVAAPLTHGASTYILPVLGCGGALVFPESSKPAALLDAARRHEVSLFFAPPTLVSSLAEEQRRSARSLPALRHLIYGGAPMRVEQIRAAQDAFGPVLCTSFGQTEAPQIATFLPPGEMRGEDMTSVGRATVMTEVLVLDADGRALPPGEKGEIAIRGDLVMSGYFAAPAETAKVLDRGLLRTGDIGVLDDRGLLFLKDRIRDVIITGGFNVYPSDVEAVVLGCPGVAHCSVVGVPDAKWGEAVHLAVELDHRAPFQRDAVLRLVREALGPVKTPKEVHVFEELPRSAVGKLLKPAIREAILQRRTAAATEPAAVL